MTTKQRFTVTLMLATNPSSEALLEKRFHYAEEVYNVIVLHCREQYNKMIADPRYKYAKGKERTAYIKQYGLTKFDLINYSKKIGKRYKKHLDSKVIQCIAKRVYTSVYRLLYKNGKQIHFKKFGTLDSIETDTNINKLRVDIEKRKLYFNGLVIKIRNKSFENWYIQEALKSPIAYPRIKRLPFNGGYRYYVELVLKGLPPEKPSTYKYEQSYGNVGIDIGTSTVAVVSDSEVILQELAPKNDDHVKKIARTNKALDRSRRANNPQYFNADGTVKKRRSHKEKRIWKKSNRYKKLQMKNKALYRKRSAYIKQEHEILANHIASLGTTFYVEKMNFAALQKKATKGQTNKAGKFKRRKRFGSSLQNRAPATLIAFINRKIIPNSINEINTNTFKASQYNHITDTYTKKSLSTRWNDLDGVPVQRDLYSAFLLMNSNADLKTTDRNKCISTYNNFLALHDKCISDLRNQKNLGKKFLSSIGV